MSSADQCPAAIEYAARGLGWSAWLTGDRGKEVVLSAVDEHQQAWKMCSLALCQPSDTFLGWLTFALPRCSMTSRR